MRRRRAPVMTVALLMAGGMAWSLASSQTFGVRKRRPKPNEYGTEIIDNFSVKNGMAPVAFPHWVHRARYTCRLCHVDIGFAMTAGATGITEEDNRHGMYCGTCHNGQIAFRWNEGSRNAPKKNCQRCHSVGLHVTMKNDFYAFHEKMPRQRFGNGIDWLKAEEEGLITLQDTLPGVSFDRPKLKNPADEELVAREIDMPKIIFSHKRHAVETGCELCHPEIFPIKKGAVTYSMQDIFDGKYCGACHGKVSFPNADCQRCHSEPVT